jgi:nucleoid-associated protein YgaU
VSLLLVIRRARKKQPRGIKMNTHRKTSRYTRGNKVLGVFLLLTVGLMTGLLWMVGTSHTTPQPHASATHSVTFKGSEPEQHVTPTPPVKVTAPKAVVHKTTTPTYTVKPGDTLWGIAGTTLHNPLDWHQLYEMNLHSIGGNPNLIHAGQVLRL